MANNTLKSLPINSSPQLQEDVSLGFGGLFISPPSSPPSSPKKVNLTTTSSPKLKQSKKVIDTPKKDIVARTIFSTIAPTTEDKKILAQYIKLFSDHLSRSLDALSLNDVAFSFTTKRSLISKQISSKGEVKVVYTIRCGIENTKEKGWDRDVGFFNFKLTNLTAPGKPALCLAYFMDISIEKPYRGKRISSGIVKAYITFLKALEEMKPSLDYLRVVSDNTFTAKLYYKNGYRFTLEAQKTLQDTSSFLKDSSNSRDYEPLIEMYRILDPNFEKTYGKVHSVAQLEANYFNPSK